MGDTPSRPEIEGDINHDAADTTTSAPVKVGVVAYNFDGTALPAAVAEADRTELRGTLDGRLLLELGHPRFFETFTTYAAAQTKASLVATPGAGLSLYITDIIYSSDTLSSASLLNDLTTTGEFVNIRMLANTTFNHTYRQPKKLTADKPLGITTNVTVTSIYVAGYIAP